MGATKCKRCDEDCGQYTFGGLIYWKPEEMKYDSDWGWIMPVVEKIEGLGYIVDIWKTSCEWYKPFEANLATEYSGNTKIETTYIAIVEFITYYNAKN